jgi:Flp pilus assembly protein TadD
MRTISTALIIILSIFSATSNATTNGNDPRLKQAKDFIEQKEYVKALPILTEVVSTDQKNAEALTSLGIVYQQLGQNDDAIKYYEMAINVDKGHKLANQHLGELYLVKGDLPKAQERLLVLEKTCPKDCVETKILKEKVDEFSKSGNKSYQINEMN